MLRTLSLLFCLLLINSSCSSFSSRPTRGVSSSVQSGLDLLAESKSIIELVATREINGESCERELGNLIADYQLLTPQNLELAIMKADGQKILDASFEARLALHSILGILPVECKSKLKELNLLIRASEDYVGVHFYQDEQIPSESIKFPEQPVPVYEMSTYHPYHVGIGMDPKAKFEFKNGDIMITKGVSFISSTISEIAHPRSLFSHIVFVHVDNETKKVETIESYVGKGVGIYNIEDALKNENSRIVVLRSKDSELAARAADYMYNKVVELKKKNKVIPYDYELNFTDNSKLSCEEVAYDSYKFASEGKIILPEVMSKITMKDAGFLKRIGIKKGMMMIPTDMETDSRFDIVLDWTDYRLMRNSWRKDAVLGEMFRWIDEHDYQIHENLTSIAAKAIWSTRYIPGLWGMLSKISGIPKDFTKDVPSLTISTMASLKIIGGILLPEVTKADQEYYAKNGKWMSTEMLRDSLEKFRESEPKNLMKVFSEK
ncbi:MAG: hypothetical protein Q7U04_00075 [Bacteriovorax sp.]|nr:hypothetical protein [Bacteriovorax sp.]